MRTKSLAFVYFTILICKDNVGAQSNTVHFVIEAEGWRSTAFIPEGITKCDRRLNTGWYRIKNENGEDMPTTCPAQNRCGTSFPIWMDGTIPPADGQEHDRKAYLNVDGDCFFTMLNIKVKNCDSYRVWYLIPPEDCPSAYCFGDKARCPAGHSSETGFQPCSDDFPKFSAIPTIAWKVARKANDKPEIVFTCNLPNSGLLNDDVVLDVEWYTMRPGEHSQRIFPPEGQRQIINVTETAELHEDDYYTIADAKARKRGPMGSYFNCSVRARHRLGGTPSPRAHSEGYFAGFKVTDEQLVVEEGKSADIGVYPTIPIVGTVLSHLPLAVVIPEYQRSTESCGNLSSTANQMLSLYDNKGCEIGVENLVFNEATWQADYDKYKKKTFKITVTAKLDNKYGNQVMAVKLKSGRFLGHILWSYFAFDVTVTITDRDIDLSGKCCRSYTDPNIITFDGRFYTDNHEGEFILMKHKNIPVQVNVYQKAVSPSAAINCAVAVKSGKDVFIVDRCYRGTGATENYHTKYPMRVGVIGCDKKGMTVTRSGNTYMVTLPTGTRVMIYPRSEWINVYIYPSVQDIGQTEGLCGTLNGNRADDLIPRFGSTPVSSPTPSFTLSWRIGEDSDESLYNGVGVDDRYSWHAYCACEKENDDAPVSDGKVVCKYDGLVDECVSKGKVIAVNELQKCEETKRRKRSADNTQIKPKYWRKFSYNASFVPEKPVWRGEWTLVKATAFCKEQIQGSSVGKVCGAIGSSIDLDSPVETCINDIHRTGSTDFLGGSIRSTTLQCEQEVKKNTSMWTVDKDTGFPQPPLQILNKLCINNCSGHGECQNEICRCEFGFAGEDCSEDVNMAPTDTYLTEDEALCDKSEDSCDVVPVNGINFMESESLSCKIQHCEIFRNEKRCGSTRRTRAEYENFEKVNCHITEQPHKRSTGSGGNLGDAYYASVTNNGGNYSTVVEMIKFDSQCIECNVTTMTCVQKNNTCFIGGECYIAGETRSVTTCLSCQPNISMSSWTQKITECYIDGSCYGNGSLKADDNCKVCNVTVNNRKWIALQGRECSNSSETSFPSTIQTSTKAFTTSSKPTIPSEDTSVMTKESTETIVDTSPFTKTKVMSTPSTKTTTSASSYKSTWVMTTESTKTNDIALPKSSTPMKVSTTPFTETTVNTSSYKSTQMATESTKTNDITLLNTSTPMKVSTTPFIETTVNTSSYKSTQITTESTKTNDIMLLNTSTPMKVSTTPFTKTIVNASTFSLTKAMTTPTMNTTETSSPKEVTSIPDEQKSTTSRADGRVTVKTTLGRTTPASTNVISTRETVSEQPRPAKDDKWVYPVVAGCACLVILLVSMVAIRYYKLSRSRRSKQNSYLRPASALSRGRSNSISPESIQYDDYTPQQWGQSAPGTTAMGGYR